MYIVPANRMLLLYWTGGYPLPDGEYFHTTDVDRLIAMARYWNKLVFHYSSDRVSFGGSPEWETAMHDLVSRLVAGGITCVNVDKVFLKLKGLGMQRTVHKWCNSTTAISVLGDHIRGRIVAIREGSNGWAAKQAAIHRGLVQRRPIQEAIRLLGMGDPHHVVEGIGLAQAIFTSQYRGELAEYAFDPLIQDASQLRAARLSPAQAAEHLGDGENQSQEVIPCAKGEEASISAHAEMCQT